MLPSHLASCPVEMRCQHSHFAAEKAEAQRHQEVPQGPMVEWENQYLNSYSKETAPDLCGSTSYEKMIMDLN